MVVKVIFLNMCISLWLLLSFATLAMAGGSTTGKDYTNFGEDLTSPIFPAHGVIRVYKNKKDKNPIATFNNIRVVNLDEDDNNKCLNKNPPDGWVLCDINGVEGWIRRSEFFSADEYKPVEKWPFRYWLYVAKNGIGSEETDMLYQVIPRSPYLIKPKQFDNVFFLTYFDKEGFAISPKTGKRTGDRVFLVGNAVYLAPDNFEKRNKIPWLFLNYFNQQMQALCPSENIDSCYSAVNLEKNWSGIKAFYTSPEAKFAWNENPDRKDKRPWFGAKEVGFARFSDPVIPFMYIVPDDVSMPNDLDSPTDEQRRKSRQKPFCILDCAGSTNPIKLDPKPGKL